MKRYFLLTSVLALAACGGGSGGGGSGIVAPNGYNEAARVSDTAITSNGKITKMKSEIVVASNSSSPIVSRAATTHSGGVTYTSYRLDDIKLYAADAKNTGDGFLQIGLDDNGRIDRMKMVLGDAGADVARDGELNKFHGPIFEFVKDNYASIDDENPFEVVKITNGEDPDDISSLLTAVATARGFTGGTWETVDGKYKYKIGEEYAKGDGGENDYEMGTSVDDILAVIKDENHFGDGKWVSSKSISGPNTNNTTYMYIEYGDQAIKRMPATANTTMSDLITPKDDNGNDVFGHWNFVDEYMTVETYGKNIGTDDNGDPVALQYSDFGHFNPVYKDKLVDLKSGEGNAKSGWTAEETKPTQDVNALMNKEDYQLFAGGYAITGTSMSDDRPTLIPENGAEYKGMAIGRVYTSIQGGGDGRATVLHNWGVPYDNNTNNGYKDVNNAGHGIAKAFTTNAEHQATLKIGANGKQTLEMPFQAAGAEFYDVTVVKDGNSAPVVTFADTNSSMGTSQYRRNSNEGTPEVDFNPGYYGVNTAEEAAGTMRYYSKENLGDGFKREWEFQAAYGMVKQPDNN